MTRFLALIVVLLFCVPAYAMPQFLQLYRSDPFRNPAVDGCITCHMSAQGGDARNPFGEAFDAAGFQITPMLRAQFPDRFVYPISRVSDALTIHFTDPDKKQLVVEAGGTKNLVDVDRTTVNGNPSTNTTSPRIIATPDSQATQSEVPVDQDAREGAFFGTNIVNLPNGKPQKGGGVDFFIGHRFGQDIKSAGLGRLFGFDTGAAITYGIRAGLSDRVSFYVYRTNLALDQIISLGSTVQATRQDATMPVTLQLRGGVDGVRNFGLYRKENNPRDRQYSPLIQVVATRTFKDRFSVTAVPMFVFNTRNEELHNAANSIGIDHNHTISLGIGAGFRFLPTTSIVGEYIPRLWGFKAGDLDFSPKDQERISVGLQKSTFRHTFQLVVSRQFAMTPARYAVQGRDTFHIGFNIYRKLR
jgi:hypothetical protein